MTAIHFFSRRMVLLLTGLLAVGASHPAAAQRASANMALLRCMKSANVPGSGKYSDESDAAGVAAFERTRQASIDSAQAVGRACLAKVDLTQVADTLWDSLATAQARSGMDTEALATLRRGLRMKSPLTDRVNAVTWILPILKPSRETVKAWREFVPFVDSMQVPQMSMQARFTMAQVVRRYDPKMAYGVVGEIVSYITPLDSAKREEAAFMLAALLNNMGTWGDADGMASECMGLTAQLMALYPWKPGLMSEVMMHGQNVSRMGVTALPFHSRLWVNPPPDTLLPTKGRVTLVMFTTTWCGPCKQSYRPLQAMYEEFRAQGLNVVIAVSAGNYYASSKAMDDSTVARYTRFFDPYGVKFPVHISTSKEHENWYGVTWPSQFFLIDRQGVVRDVWNGGFPLQGPRMRKKVIELLGEA